jgi:sarcosine oxidase subunit beta
MSGVTRTDVIVIGGGIMGAATAFFLRKRGIAVALIERGLIGQQASGTNFGNVRRQGRYLKQLPLANRSREIWGRLHELLGEDVEFLPSGHLRLAYNDEMTAKIEGYAAEARLGPQSCRHGRPRTCVRAESRRPGRSRAGPAAPARN